MASQPPLIPFYIMGNPVQCWLCKRMEPSACSINVNMTGNGSTPSRMEPLCQECAANQIKPPPVEFPYHETFWAIADAVNQQSGAIGISVDKFQESFNRRMAERKS